MTESDGCLSLSIYCSDKEASDDALSVGVLHLKNAFQDKANDMVCAEIIRLARKSEMGEQQFLDAIDHFIMHNRYNIVNVADILDYDVRLKFYTGEEVRRICGSFGLERDKERFPRYGMINGRIYCVSAEQVANLPPMQREKIMNHIKNFENERRRGNREEDPVDPMAG